jgi:hypothetical protein
MTRPIDAKYKITASFDEARPLDAKPGDPCHNHGGVDFGAPIGTLILSPEAGTVYHYRALRQPPGSAIWPDAAPDFQGIPFPFVNYFYDMFGAITLLVGNTGRCHIFAHAYFHQLYGECPWAWDHLEQRAEGRWVLECWHTFKHPRTVGEGMKIAVTGRSGYCTGPHSHWEIHPSWKRWTPWADRIDPEDYLRGRI